MTTILPNIINPALALVPGCVASKTTKATIESDQYGTVTLDRSVSLDTGTQAAE